MLTHFDPELGIPLEQKSYGGSCLLYDTNNTDPFHNIWVNSESCLYQTTMGSTFVFEINRCLDYTG